MKTAFTNFDELKREMAMIKLQEEKNNFVKKQFLAYELYEIMKQNGFTGIKLINEHNWSFDAKNEKEDFEVLEVRRFRKLIMAEHLESNSSFKGLKTLADRVKSFFEQEESTQLQREIAQEMYGKTVACDYKSVCEAVMTPSEYQEFTVLIEQELISQKIPFDKLHGKKSQKI